MYGKLIQRRPKKKKMDEFIESDSEIISSMTGAPLSTSNIDGPESSRTASGSVTSHSESGRDQDKSRKEPSELGRAETGPGKRGTSPSGHHFQKGLIERSKMTRDAWSA